jgi:hypothetical protein
VMIPKSKTPARVERAGDKCWFFTIPCKFTIPQASA